MVTSPYHHLHRLLDTTPHIQKYINFFTTELSGIKNCLLARYFCLSFRRLVFVSSNHRLASFHVELSTCIYPVYVLDGKSQNHSLNDILFLLGQNFMLARSPGLLYVWCNNWKQIKLLTCSSINTVSTLEGFRCDHYIWCKTRLRKSKNSVKLIWG